MKKEYANDALWGDVLAGGAKLQAAIAHIYQDAQVKKQVMAFVRSRSGSKEDAEDVFHDGVKTLILNVRAGKYKGEGSLSAYLFGVCKRLWFKRFQKIRRNAGYAEVATADNDLDPEDPELLILSHEREKQIDTMLARLGPACKRVLQMWQLSFSMTEIAEALGYKNEGVARKKKRLCMIKLLDLLEKEPELLAFLKDLQQ